MKMKEKTLNITDEALLNMLFGNLDEVANAIENALKVTIHYRNSEIVISGQMPRVDLTIQLIEQLYARIQSGEAVTMQTVNYHIDMLKEAHGIVDDYYRDVIITTPKGDKIVPRTLTQAEYVKAIRRSDIVFGLGPAGTGKTFIAVAMAVSFLKRRKVNKIIITRPAVEAGERLGYLPGDLEQKIEPYLKPIDDALNRILGAAVYSSYREKNAIEIVPLAYMRGRTLEDAFIILDEAQNSSIDQMKMFLTRIGKGSKVIVNGDTSQVDLEGNKKSGLIHATKLLQPIEGIEVIAFQKCDVVRHRLVKDIIEAYNKAEKHDRNH